MLQTVKSIKTVFHFNHIVALVLLWCSQNKDLRYTSYDDFRHNFRRTVNDAHLIIVPQICERIRLVVPMVLPKRKTILRNELRVMHM